MPSIASLGLSNKYLEPYDAGGSLAYGLILDKESVIPGALSCLGITLDVIKQIGNRCQSKLVKNRLPWYSMSGMYVLVSINSIS